MNLFQHRCKLYKCFFSLIQTWYVPSWWIRHPVAEWINTRGKNLAAGAKSSQPVRHGRQALKPHKESELEVRPPSRFTWGCASRSPVVLGASHAAKKNPKKTQAFSPNFQQTSVSSLELQTCLINIISPNWDWGSGGGGWFACVINMHRGYLLDASWKVAALLCRRSPCWFSNKRAFLVIAKTIPSCVRLRIRRLTSHAGGQRDTGACTCISCAKLRATQNEAPVLRDGALYVWALTIWFVITHRGNGMLLILLKLYYVSPDGVP